MRRIVRHIVVMALPAFAVLAASGDVRALTECVGENCETAPDQAIVARQGPKCPWRNRTIHWKPAPDRDAGRPADQQ